MGAKGNGLKFAEHNPSPLAATPLRAPRVGLFEQALV